VDIDTRAEYARYWIQEPARIDFQTIEEAVDDAGYTLKVIELDIAGRVETGPCTTCGESVPFLHVPETGQAIELSGDAPTETGRVSGHVTGWAEGHPRLELESVPDTDGG